MPEDIIKNLAKGPEVQKADRNSMNYYKHLQRKKFAHNEKESEITEVPKFDFRKIKVETDKSLAPSLKIKYWQFWYGDIDAKLAKNIITHAYPKSIVELDPEIGTFTGNFIIYVKDNIVFDHVKERDEAVGAEEDLTETPESRIPVKSNVSGYETDINSNIDDSEYETDDDGEDTSVSQEINNNFDHLDTNKFVKPDASAINDPEDAENDGPIQADSGKPFPKDGNIGVRANEGKTIVTDAKYEDG